MTIIGGVGTIANVYLTMKIANSIAKVQLWAKDTFVAKGDLAMYIRRSRATERG